MSSKPVVALAEIEGDLERAMAYYATWRSDGATHLLEKYDETVGWIEWNPGSFPRKYGAVQRAILKQSHYIVYFIQEADRSLVLAVLDGRRSPVEIREIVSTRQRSPRPPQT